MVDAPCFISQCIRMHFCQHPTDILAAFLIGMNPTNEDEPKHPNSKVKNAQSDTLSIFFISFFFNILLPNDISAYYTFFN